MSVIPLSQGLEAIVDSEDFEKLSQYSWYARSNGNKNPKIYAARSTPGNWNKKIYLHRELLNAPKGMQVDHINGNTLDNRKENLRLCTRKQNLQNRSKACEPKLSIYKGIRFIKNGKNLTRPWGAVLKNKFVGYFVTEEEAAKAYDIAAKEVYGEFANLNFKEEN